MFCLDYACSFAAFAALRSAARDTGFGDVIGSPILSIFTGAMSGLFAAVVLYPVDLVRQIALADTAKSSFAVSSIPFTTCYLGLFFGWHKREASFSEKLGVATVATGLASLAEFPFDYSKHLMAGSRSKAMMFSSLRVPISTLLLLAFDAALTS